MTAQKKATETFKVGDCVVYPVHGVGRLVGIESYEIEGITSTLMVITFDRDHMTLRLPLNKAEAAGLRPLSTKDDMEEAFSNLRQKARVRRTMWSRRAQEYETKINSGDPRSIAEVIRDLYRSASQPEQSYSERQIYQAAMSRLAREIAAIESIDETAATHKVEDILKAA